MDADGQRTVVVGTSSLAESRAALVWAAREASRRGALLLVVHAQAQPVVLDGTAAALTPEVAAHLEAAAREELRAARRAARESADVEVRAVLAREHPRRALLRHARSAELVVSGARRRSRLRAGLFGAFQLGSTSLFLASHACCPVAVVRDLPAPGAHGVVVGWDGSPAAQAAAGWAAAHAAALDVPLRVVTAWQTPLDRTAELAPAAFGEAHEAAEAAARGAQQDLLTRWRAQHPGLRVRGEVVEDPFASDAVLTAAEGAELVVVGSRGHGAFASALLGSTSHEVLHRARGPVVVVPDAERAAARSRRAPLDPPAGGQADETVD